MNRRSFLKFAGLAPVVPGLVIGALESQPKMFSYYFTWDENQSTPIDDMKTAIKILERTNSNKPRHYVISPGVYRHLMRWS